MKCPYCNNEFFLVGLVKDMYQCLKCEEYFRPTQEQCRMLEMLDWFVGLTEEQQIKIIKPHYVKWYNDQQIALEAKRGDT